MFIVLFLFLAVAVCVMLDMNYFNFYNNTIEGWVNVIVNIIYAMGVIFFYLLLLFGIMFSGIGRETGDNEFYSVTGGLLLVFTVLRFLVYSKFNLKGSRIVIAVSILLMYIFLFSAIDQSYEIEVYDLAFLGSNYIEIVSILLLFYIEIFLTMNLHSGDIKIKLKKLFIIIDIIFIVLESFIFWQYFNNGFISKVIIIDIINLIVLYGFIYLPAWLVTIKTDMKSRKYLCVAMFILLMISVYGLLTCFSDLESIRKTNMFVTLFFISFKASLLQKNKVEIL